MRVWPFMPQSTFRETLAWLTDVIQTKAQEQRLSLRRVPRRTFEYTFLLEKNEWAIAQVLARNSHEPYLVPMWRDIGFVGTLANTTLTPVLGATFHATRHYRMGGRVLLWTSNTRYEVRTISIIYPEGRVQFTEPVTIPNAYMAPLVEARLTGPVEAQLSTFDLIEVKATFESTEDLGVNPLQRSTTYRGHPVVDDPVISGTLTESDFRDVEIIDSHTGPVWFGASRAKPTHVSELKWSFLDRESHWEWYRWLFSVRGRWKAFFRPSQNIDFKPIATPSANSTTVYVARTGLTSADLPAGGFDVVLRTAAGPLYRGVLSFVPGATDTTDALVLSQVYGSTSPLLGVSFLRFCRLDSDRIEQRFGPGGIVTASAPIVELPALVDP